MLYEIIIRLQIDQPGIWRKLKSRGKTKEPEAMVPDMLLGLNAIAGGPKTTG